jgi:hypothetical protein
MLVATGLASAAVERRKASASLPTSPASGGGEGDKDALPHPMVRTWLDGAYRRSASLHSGGKCFVTLAGKLGCGCIAGTRAHAVIAGHSHSKNGVASLAYVPAISLRRALCQRSRDGRDKPGHDEAGRGGKNTGGAMKGKYPDGMTLTRWRRLPFQIRHRLVGLALNAQFRYWGTCADARCRRARACQDYTCYWRRLQGLPFEETMRVRNLAKPWKEILWIGSNRGSEGRPLF